MSACIIATAARLTGVPVREIVGREDRRRFRHLTRIRYACYIVAREHGYTQSGIGRRVGTDPTAVLYGQRVAENFMSRDPEYARFVADLLDAATNAPASIRTPYGFLPRGEARPVLPPAVRRASVKPRNDFTLHETADA